MRLSNSMIVLSGSSKDLSSSLAVSGPFIYSNYHFKSLGYRFFIVYGHREDLFFNFSDNISLLKILLTSWVFLDQGLLMRNQIQIYTFCNCLSMSSPAMKE